MRDDVRCLPRLGIALPPLVTRGVDDARSRRLVDGSADGPEGFSYLPRIGRSAGRSAPAKGGEAGFEGDGFFIGEGRGTEAASLVGGGEPGHGGGHRGSRHLHAKRELARRLGGAPPGAAPRRGGGGGGGGGGRREERGGGGGGAGAGGPGGGAPRRPPRDEGGGPGTGCPARGHLAGRRQPPPRAAPPLARPAVHGGGHADL